MFDIFTNVSQQGLFTYFKHQFVMRPTELRVLPLGIVGRKTLLMAFFSLISLFSLPGFGFEENNMSLIKYMTRKIFLQ